MDRFLDYRFECISGDKNCSTGLTSSEEDLLGKIYSIKYFLREFAENFDSSMNIDANGKYSIFPLIKESLDQPIRDFLIECCDKNTSINNHKIIADTPDLKKFSFSKFLAKNIKSQHRSWCSDAERLFHHAYHKVEELIITNQSDAECKRLEILCEVIEMMKIFAEFIITKRSKVIVSAPDFHENTRREVRYKKKPDTEGFCQLCWRDSMEFEYLPGFGKKETMEFILGTLKQSHNNIIDQGLSMAFDAFGDEMCKLICNRQIKFAEYLELIKTYLDDPLNEFFSSSTQLEFIKSNCEIEFISCNLTFSKRFELWKPEEIENHILDSLNVMVNFEGGDGGFRSVLQRLCDVISIVLYQPTSQEILQPNDSIKRNKPIVVNRSYCYEHQHSVTYLCPECGKTTRGVLSKIKDSQTKVNIWRCDSCEITRKDNKGVPISLSAQEGEYIKGRYYLDKKNEVAFEREINWLNQCIREKRLETMRPGAFLKMAYRNCRPSLRSKANQVRDYYKLDSNVTHDQLAGKFKVTRQAVTKALRDA